VRDDDDDDVVDYHTILSATTSEGAKALLGENAT